MQQVQMRSLADRFMQGVMPPADRAGRDLYFDVLQANMRKAAKCDPEVYDLDLALGLLAGICPPEAAPYWGWS